MRRRNSDNLIKDNQIAGISIEQSQNVVVEKNTIKDNDSWGVYIGYNPGTWLPGAPVVETKNNSIDANTVQGNPTGVTIEHCHFEPYNKITNNLIQNNHIGVKTVNAIVFMDGNTFSGNDKDVEEE